MDVVSIVPLVIMIHKFLDDSAFFLCILIAGYAQITLLIPEKSDPENNNCGFAVLIGLSLIINLFLLVIIIVDINSKCSYPFLVSLFVCVFFCSHVE